MKKLLLSLSMFILFVHVNAQQEFWDETSTGFPNTSTNVSMFSYSDANTIWAIASAGDGSSDTYQQWARSTDSGLTWTNGTIDIGNTAYGIGSIVGLSSTVAYICASPGAGGPGGGVWKTTDGGVTWVKQTTAAFNGSTSFVNIVHFWDENNGVCQGDPVGGYFEIYTTTNGGVNWVRVPSANIPPPLPGEFCYTTNLEVVGNTIWCGGNKGRIFKSIDKGLNWTVAQSPSVDFGGGDSYTFQDQNEGLLVLREGAGEQYRSLDGGATWTEEIPTGLVRNFEITYVPGTPNFVVCSGEDIIDLVRGSSYSTDGGLNWIDINAVDVEPIQAFALNFFDYEHGMASDFTTSSTVGGAWKWKAPVLANESFTTTKSHILSPNPTIGLVTITGKGISNIVVTDLLGKQVAATNYTTVETATIDMATYNAGVYMVKVTNTDGAASTIKVVRQ